MNFEDKLARNVKEDPKSFYAYAQSKYNTKISVGPLKTPDGLEATNDMESAELLNQQFSNVFTREDQEQMPQPTTFFTGAEEERLTDAIFTLQEIESRLQKTKPNKAQGPGEMHPRFRVLSRNAAILNVQEDLGHKCSTE
jgi:hypothetical protein